MVGSAFPCALLPHDVQPPGPIEKDQAQQQFNIIHVPLLSYDAVPNVAAVRCAPTLLPDSSLGVCWFFILH
jgi:hypothetical protein